VASFHAVLDLSLQPVTGVYIIITQFNDRLAANKAREVIAKLPEKDAFDEQVEEELCTELVTVSLSNNDDTECS